MTIRADQKVLIGLDGPWFWRTQAPQLKCLESVEPGSTAKEQGSRQDHHPLLTNPTPQHLKGGMEHLHLIELSEDISSAD